MVPFTSYILEALVSCVTPCTYDPAFCYYNTPPSDFPEPGWYAGRVNSCNILCSVKNQVPNFVVMAAEDLLLPIGRSMGGKFVGERMFVHSPL